MKRFTLAACAAFVFFTAASIDLALRSRTALQTADRHALWHANPHLKTQHYSALCEQKLARLNREVAAGKINKQAAQRQTALIITEKDFYLSESSAKLAWMWYKTAAEKFQSPFNPWAAIARTRMPAAKETWRAELFAKKLGTQEWRIE